MRAVAILARARTRRLAMVASGTRKARAMAGTSRRASVRSERATWASRLSAGWQQVKIRRSMSSRSDVSGSIASIASSIWSGAAPVPHRNAAVSLAARADSRRSRSSALRRATTASQARGSSGIPVLGHRSRAVIVASESASSATARSPMVLASVASTLGPSPFSTSTRVAVASIPGCLAVGRRYRAKLDLPPPGSRDLHRPRDGLVQVGRLQQKVPGQDLLRLSVRTVGHQDVAALAARDGDGRRHGYRVQGFAAAHDPGLGGPPGELRVLGGELHIRHRVPVAVPVVVAQGHIQRHRQPSFRSATMPYRFTWATTTATTAATALEPVWIRVQGGSPGREAPRTRKTAP